MGRKARQKRTEKIRRWVWYDNPIQFWVRTELGSTWDRRKFWFLFTGWRKSLHDKGRYSSKAQYEHRLIEPARAIRSRHAILATSAAVIVAWAGGMGPDSIKVAGISLEGVTGTATTSLAIILGQLCCWIMRYTEMVEDGEWEHFDKGGKPVTEKLRYARGVDIAPDGHSLIDRTEYDHTGQQKLANWLTNRVAGLGTLATWGIAVWWIWKASGCGGIPGA